MGRLRDLDRWAEGFGGGRLERTLAVAGTPVVVGLILIAVVVGRLREGSGVVLAVLGGLLMVGGPLTALYLHQRGRADRG